MDDLISRQAAIDVMLMAIDDDWDPDYATDRMDEIPSAQPTLYGYNIEPLALIARVMQKKGVTPEKAVDIFQDIVGIVQMYTDEQKENHKKAVEHYAEIH